MSVKRKGRGYLNVSHHGILMLASVLFFALLITIGVVRTKFSNLFSQSSESFIYVDHNSVTLFDSIPNEYLTAARNLHQVFSDRSVGQNINESLDCLAGKKSDGTYTNKWYEVKSACRVDYSSNSGNTWYTRVFNKTDYDNGTVPSHILFSPDPQKYSRANWTFVVKAGSWSYLTQDFIQTLAPANIANNDVLSYQFSYLNVTDNDTIADPVKGFFVNTSSYDIYDLENYISQHTDKNFIFWTTSLARGIGTKNAQDFNNQMRQYAIEHNKILFDVADIESHDPSGNPCFDNRDGVGYCTQNGVCENYADDNLDYPAICRDYTTEVDGGHLGAVSGAQIRIAKAYWVLMAQIAGWNPNQPVPTTALETLTPNPTSSPTSVPTNVPTITSAPTATPTTAPSESFNFTAAPGCSLITLNWNSITNATGYFVDKCQDVQSNCGGKWTRFIVYKPITTYSDSAVTNGLPYTYRLYAYKSDSTFTPASYQTTTPSCN